MSLRYLLSILILLFSITCLAQTFSVAGRLIDSKDNSPLIGVTVIINNKTDTNKTAGGYSDTSGNFKIDGVSDGDYIVKFDYLGYKTITKNIIIIGGNEDVGIIKLSAGSNELHGVTVSGHQVRADQLGDTTQFHADAYKTHPDATAEDLVNKMPGVSSDNSGVKVNGESVQQVYVDGKPFFGTDPTLALRNLPSEIVDKIQIFDKLSDQSQFTGFDDGNSQKTMNILTKKNKSEGVFGKLYGGYGTDERDIAGGNVNIFDGDRRISVIGLSNNINQQNFSIQDILGVVGSSGGNGGGGGGRGMFGGGSGGGSGASNFLVGQQNGITNTNSIGLNYSDNWGKKIKVSASYFYNVTDNTNQTLTTRNYFDTSNITNIYQDNDNAEAKNWNHRFNLRFEYTVDSFNSITWTPNFTIQKNITTDVSAAGDTIADKLASSTANHSTANNSGYTFSNNLLLQHKFKLPRRTISMNINTSLNEKSGTGTYYSNNNRYYDGLDSATFYDQRYTIYNNGYTIGTNITYTEPVGKKGQLMANYYPSVSKSISNKETSDFDTLSHLFDYFDTLHSNKYASTYTTQKAGLSYRIGSKGINFMVGVNLQFATLEEQQDFPSSLRIQKNFTDVLPTMTFNYRKRNGKNLRVMYRTNISPPSVTQLQNVVDISNPLLLTTGNITLRQDYEQTLVVRYGSINTKSAHNFFVFGNINYINNYIGNLTIIPHLHDTLFNSPVLRNPVFVTRGSQLSLPYNLNGYLTARSFITYGIPADFIKSNLNLSGGLNYTRTPGQINSLVNYSNNYAPTAGIVLSSNVSEDLDFTLAYTPSYNIVENTSNHQANNNYYSHTASFKVNWILLKRIVINTNFTNSYYTAFSSTGIVDYNLWTSYVAYKFMKKKAMEARFTVFDMLSENKSVSRSVTGTYVENDITQVLKQYFMLQLTYTIRNFKGQAPPDPDKPHDHDMNNMPPQWQRFRGGGNGGGDWH